MLDLLWNGHLWTLNHSKSYKRTWQRFLVLRQSGTPSKHMWMPCLLPFGQGLACRPSSRMPGNVLEKERRFLHVWRSCRSCRPAHPKTPLKGHPKGVLKRLAQKQVHPGQPQPRQRKMSRDHRDRRLAFVLFACLADLEVVWMSNYWLLMLLQLHSIMIVGDVPLVIAIWPLCLIANEIVISLSSWLWSLATSSSFSLSCSSNVHLFGPK